MARRTKIAGLMGAALLAAGCREAMSPERRAPGAPLLDVAAGSGITLDQKNSASGEHGTVLTKGFNPTNPRLGDAIVATFFWRSSTTTNIIDSVVDRQSNLTRVGNTYRLVQFMNAGGVSMATYVATNVQNFPSPNQDTGGLLVVQAFLSESVADGGLIFSAFTGVQADFFQALGESRSAAGVSTTQTQTVAHPGPITVNGGALAFGVTLSIPSASVGMFPQAEAFQRIEGTSDLVMAVETDYALPDATRPVDPQWTWFYDSQTSGCSPSTPCTWLASALALNPGAAPPPPPPPPTVDAARSSVVASPTTITAGSGTSTITVTARDASGNPVSGVNVVLSATGSGNTLTQPAGPTNASGVATGTLSSTVAGTKTVSATAGGVTITQTAAVTVTAGAVSASQSTIAAGSGTSTITVTARDANGNAVSGATVVLAATGSGNTLTQPAGATNASGVATGTLSST